MKKALIDQLLLGAFLFTVMVAFVATVNDELNTRNKVYELKGIAKKAALAAGKYYSDVDQNTNDAEAIADDIVQEMTSGTVSISSYNWDFASSPNTITATISNYQQSTFWYRFLEKDSFSISVYHLAEFIPGGLSETSTPLAINGCADAATGDETLIDSYVGAQAFTFDVPLGNGIKNKFNNNNYVTYDPSTKNKFYTLGDGNNPTSNSNNELSNFWKKAMNGSEDLPNTSDLGHFIELGDNTKNSHNNAISQGFGSSLPREIIVAVLGCNTTLSTSGHTIDIIDTVTIEVSNVTSTNPYTIDFEILGSAGIGGVIPTTK